MPVAGTSRCDFQLLFPRFVPGNAVQALAAAGLLVEAGVRAIYEAARGSASKPGLQSFDSIVLSGHAPL